MKKNVTYRLNQFVHTDHCILDATPVPPNPIDYENVNVSHFDISGDNKINFTISWLHPLETYGQVASYEVVVAKEPLTAQESAEASPSVVFRKAGDIIFSVSWLKFDTLYHCGRPVQSG